MISTLPHLRVISTIIISIMLSSISNMTIGSGFISAAMSFYTLTLYTDNEVGIIYNTSLICIGLLLNNSYLVVLSIMIGMANYVYYVNTLSNTSRFQKQIDILTEQNGEWVVEYILNNAVNNLGSHTLKNIRRTTDSDIETESDSSNCSDYTDITETSDDIETESETTESSLSEIEKIEDIIDDAINGVTLNDKITQMYEILKKLGKYRNKYNSDDSDDSENSEYSTEDSEYSTEDDENSEYSTEYENSIDDEDEPTCEQYESDSDIVKFSITKKIIEDVTVIINQHDEPIVEYALKTLNNINTNNDNLVGFTDTLSKHINTEDGEKFVQLLNTLLVDNLEYIFGRKYMLNCAIELLEAFSKNAASNEETNNSGFLSLLEKIKSKITMYYILSKL